MAIVTHVDEYFLRAKVSFPYPSVVIEEKNIEALSILMESLEEGEVSVVFLYNGKYNVAKKKISNSALTLLKLLEVYKFTAKVSPDRTYKVSTARDILEIGEWM